MTKVPTEYLRELGSKGGLSTSEAKQKAARENLARARSLRWKKRAPKKKEAING